MSIPGLEMIIEKNLALKFENQRLKARVAELESRLKEYEFQDSHGWPVECSGDKPTCQWVSVKERLPKELDDVLTFDDDGGLQVRSYYKGRWDQFDGFVRITHWLDGVPPIPTDTEEAI